MNDKFISVMYFEDVRKSIAYQNQNKKGRCGQQMRKEAQ